SPTSTCPNGQGCVGPDSRLPEASNDVAKSAASCASITPPHGIRQIEEQKLATARRNRETRERSTRTSMKIGLFGGTFDPIHRGHIALAQAARDQFGLARILFVPSNVPPHKQKQPLSSFAQRYAMVALATAAEKSFVPSLLEAPAENARAAPAKTEPRAVPTPNYTIDTVRRLKQTLKKIDQIFFLIGIDAFREIAKWHESEALFAECAFIV